MADFSPAAQAVLDAYGSSPLLNDHVLDHRRCLAAALRAAADHLSYQLPFEDLHCIAVPDLLAIAAELEGAND